MTALEIAKQFEGRADDAGKLARAVIAESALSQSERKITRDAPVAPGMMSEAENRSGRADREQTASSGKPEQFVCRCAGEEGLLCLKWCGDKACKDAPQQVEGTASAPVYQSATPAGALPSSTRANMLAADGDEFFRRIRDGSSVPFASTSFDLWARDKWPKISKELRGIPSAIGESKK